MALALNDRVRQTGTANTTVSFTLSGTVTGFQSFAVIGNANTTYYAATDASGNWEVGLGTYSTTGPTLTRTTIFSSSNANAAETFSGTVNVFVTMPSSQTVYEDAAGNVGINTITPTSIGVNTRYITVNSPAGTGTQSGLSSKVNNVEQGYVYGDGAIFNVESAPGLPLRLWTPPSQPLIFGTNYTERMRIDSLGNVGIGTTTSPTAKLTIYTDGNLVYDHMSFTSPASTNQYFFGIGTGGGSSDHLGIYGLGSTTNIIFTTNGANRMRILADGSVLVTSPAGLGYGTGAGGSVTQATSKATTVTLNKPTGRITTTADPMVAGATVEFQINNSLINDGDIFICNVQDPLGYTVVTRRAFAGAAVLRLTNVSAGSLSQAVNISFAIIRGAIT